MDFANISLRDASEKATPVHLELDGKPLFLQADKTIGVEQTDHPCRVLIRGVGSDKVLNVAKEIERLEMIHSARIQRTKDKDLPALIESHQEAVRDAMGRLTHAAVMGFENIVFDGKPVEASPEYIDRLCAPRTAFFEQVNEAIMERKRFLTPAATA